MRIKLATWNVERVVPSSRSGRFARVRDWLLTVDADVLVLTETHVDLSPGDGFSAVHTRGADRTQAEGERWTSVWSRFPIEGVEPASDPVRAVAARVTPPSGPPLVVYGTVLPWLGSPWRDVPAAGGRAFRAALDAQSADWVRLAADHPDADLCVLGDLNQDLGGRHYYGSRSNRQALEEALGAAGLVALTGGDRDPVRRRNPKRASIDHICVPMASRRTPSGALEVWPATPDPDRSLSDHFGVAAVLGAAMGPDARRRTSSGVVAATPTSCPTRRGPRSADPRGS